MADDRMLKQGFALAMRLLAYASTTYFGLAIAPVLGSLPRALAAAAGLTYGILLYEAVGALVRRSYRPRFVRATEPNPEGRLALQAQDYEYRVAQEKAIMTNGAHYAMNAAVVLLLWSLSHVIALGAFEGTPLLLGFTGALLFPFVFLGQIAIIAASGAMGGGRIAAFGVGLAFQAPLLLYTAYAVKLGLG